MKRTIAHRLMIIFFIVVIYNCPGGIQAAQVTSHFQGYLIAADGKPLNGNVDIEINIYSVPQGGAPLWTETHPGILVVNGIANVMLGSITTLSSEIFQGPCYISARVAGGAEILPRRQFVSLFFAIKAHEAEQLDGSVNGGSIVAGSIDSTKLNAQSFKGNKGPQGTIGDKGPVGHQGERGPAGPGSTFFTHQ